MDVIFLCQCVEFVIIYSGHFSKSIGVGGELGEMADFKCFGSGIIVCGVKAWQGEEDYFAAVGF